MSAITQTSALKAEHSVLDHTIAAGEPWLQWLG